MVEGAESHAAQVWPCVGTLAILDRLDIVDKDTLCWWLCERQLPNGGLNGRPEKLEDVSWMAFTFLPRNPSDRKTELLLLVGLRALAHSRQSRLDLARQACFLHLVLPGYGEGWPSRSS